MTVKCLWMKCFNDHDILDQLLVSRAFSKYWSSKCTITCLHNVAQIFDNGARSYPAAFHGRYLLKKCRYLMLSWVILILLLIQNVYFECPMKYVLHTLLNSICRYHFLLHFGLISVLMCNASSTWSSFLYKNCSWK